MRLLEEAETGRGPAFDRVVIETTGLADPLPLLQTFMTNDLIISRFALNGVVTLVDAVNGADALDRFEEAQRQAAVADLIVVTKGDLAHDPASRRDLAALLRQLGRAAPTAAVLAAEEATAQAVFCRAAFDPAGAAPDVRAWLRFEASQAPRHDHPHHHGHDHAHDVNRHGDTATAFCFEADQAVKAEALENAVAALQRSFGRDLLRVKGLVALCEDPERRCVLHVVGHVAGPLRLLERWPKGIERTRLVLIVAGAGRAAAADMLGRFLPQVRAFDPGSAVSPATA